MRLSSQDRETKQDGVAVPASAVSGCTRPDGALDDIKQHQSPKDQDTDGQSDHSLFAQMHGRTLAQTVVFLRFAKMRA